MGRLERKLEKRKAQQRELQLEKYDFIDIYMIDYNSPRNYYRCLTVPNESIHLFYLEKGEIFDWIATSVFLKALIK